MTIKKPAQLFYSYASKDEEHLTRLTVHLSLLRREGRISEWYNRKIQPGDEWNKSIADQLERADAFLLLVSPDFMHSDYCWGVEVRRALERRARNEAIVVPVIVKTADWHSAPFGKLQALPTDGRPITKWGNRDEAWANVASGLRSLLDQQQP